MDIGQKIKERRQALGMTLEEVGNAVGVGKSTVRKWEQGMIKNMRRDKIALLAATLQIDPADLINYEPQQPQGLTDDEVRMLMAYRQADDHAKEYALDMLLAHPKAQKKENLA